MRAPLGPRPRTARLPSTSPVNPLTPSPPPAPCAALQEDATEHVDEVLERVKPEYLRRAYKLKAWANAEDFLAQVARLTGARSPSGRSTGWLGGVDGRGRGSGGRAWLWRRWRTHVWGVGGVVAGRALLGAGGGVGASMFAQLP